MSTSMSREHLTDVPANRMHRDAQSTIDEALHALATYEGEDILGLKLHLAAVLNGATSPVSPTELSENLTDDHIRRQLAGRLTSAWPRMEFAGHAQDVADAVLQIIQPVIAQLHVEAAAWRAKAQRAVEQREGARALAISLEQMAAEAARLLRVGQPGPALAVLESDGGPLAPCAAPLFVDDTTCARPMDHAGARSEDAQYVDSAAEGVWLPERMFVVVAIRRCADGDFPVLDLHGAYPLVEDASSRARDLVLELSPGELAEFTSPVDSPLSLTAQPSGSFTGLIKVVELEVDPEASDAAREAEYEARRDDRCAPDHGRELRGEEWASRS